ncbi:MAG: DUF6143 family protein [Peptostreptococcaceae bacterium]
MSCNNILEIKEVSIDYPLEQSRKGRYYIGQTPLFIGPTSRAIGALVNPKNSNVNIYLNAITVSNISDQFLSAAVYLRVTPPVGDISPHVSCTNVTIEPQPQPYGQIQYKDSVTNPPTTGVSIFTRIVPSASTTVIDGGQIIIPPNSCILVYIDDLLEDSAIVAFGWWEEPVSKYCCNDPCFY